METSSLTTLLSLEDLQVEAVSFANTLHPNTSHALLVTLSGELGAGKTSFTQGIAKTFGITDAITSPTFVLEKRYPLENQSFSQLVHIDAYRLEGERSLVPLGFEELYEDNTNLIVLEWPELVQNQLPIADHAVTLSVVENGRTISYA